MSEYIEIPYQRLSNETLQALIEEYICRDGTDYGVVELSLEQKVERLQQQLSAGRALIVFDPVTESCTFRSRDV